MQNEERKSCSDSESIFFAFLRNGVEIDSEFWERGFVHSLGFKNRRSVDIFRLFKVQNMGKISCQNSESIFSSFLRKKLGK
ncbi:MAG: hypothetical protein ACI85O_001683 [Saprospiraceae bacterium]